jgi:osmoprotectant transport system ATP-binding protein
LSSPAGLGVAVDADGRPIGGVQADDVLVMLNAQRPKALPRLGSADDGAG